MEIIGAIIYFTIIVILLLYPVLSIMQLVYSVICYFQKGFAQAFYRDLGRYLLASALYILVAILLFAPALADLRPFDASNFGFLYFFILPLPIALYNIVMMKKEYPEEIEKQII